VEAVSRTAEHRIEASTWLARAEFSQLSIFKLEKRLLKWGFFKKDKEK
jgi:hypothetical protein